MPSAQECAERLREQAYRTLLPQIKDLEQELQNISNSLSTGVHLLGQKLDTLHHIELPTTELVLTEILGEVVRQKDLEANALVLFARILHSKETQEEILALLLDAAQKYFPRTALFTVRGNRFVGWSSRGYSDSLSHKISSCTFLRSDTPKFEEALTAETPVIAGEFTDRDPFHFLQEETEGPYRLLPLQVLQRPVALLLVGGVAKTPGDTDALSILTELTMLRLENIALKILYEVTAASPGAAPAQKPVETTPPPAFTPEPEPAAVHEVLAPVPEPSSTPEPSYDLDFGQKPAPAFEAAAPVVAVEPPTIVEAEPVIEEEPPAVEAVAAPFIAEELPPIEVLAKEEVQPVPKIETPTIQKQEVKAAPGEEKHHSDAKRFARLLVSEIKLYNEHHVSEGRQNRDLYLRLKRDIDRSREMYEKRISPNVARRIDYFHDEIIRILGDNDPATLGSDYPGPRVES
jgi:hypothetical protein